MQQDAKDTMNGKNTANEGQTFRKMRRFKQALPPEECAEVLTDAPRGVLSLIGENGYPYGIPMDHLYCPEDGHLYFHCAKEGHKIDAIRACDRASYCVYDEGFRKEGDWALNIRSVVVFGHIREVVDEEKKREICTRLVRKFTDDEDYLAHELAHAFRNVKCLELVPDHMTGKLVNES